MRCFALLNTAPQLSKRRHEATAEFRSYLHQVIIISGRCWDGVCALSSSAPKRDQPAVTQGPESSNGQRISEHTGEPPEWPQQWACSKPTGVTSSPDLVWLILESPQRRPPRLGVFFSARVPQHQRFLSPRYERSLGGSPTFPQLFRNPERSFCIRKPLASQPPTSLFHGAIDCYQPAVSSGDTGFLGRTRPSFVTTSATRHHTVDQRCV
ncbi:uncharacterized protein B0H64DRAFT_29802 [Chaetomium fimeti]|uniref:Uncharacterized protein n=1 Tax=Chaetomium fimeti TaxID=1854472 RepID=A0AAE0LXI0_9PEZI|nr:hypothetical protein B0H64DRAFT_29802 [Chaetomium fimeti]